MKEKRILTMLLALFCVFCTFSACNEEVPAVDSSSVEDYTDPSMDDIYE